MTSEKASAADDLDPRSCGAFTLNVVVGLALFLSVALLSMFVAALLAANAGEAAAALGGVAGGVFGGALAAYAAYVSVKSTLEGQARNDDERRAQELAAIRLALHTEVGIIANVCFSELRDWQRILPVVGQQKDPRNIPPLTIYHSVSGNIGRLTRGEIVSLISFAGTLYKIEVVAKRIDENVIQAKSNQETIALLLSDACGEAADFYEAVRNTGRQSRSVICRSTENCFSVDAIRQGSGFRPVDRLRMGEAAPKRAADSCRSRKLSPLKTLDVRRSRSPTHHYERGHA